MRGQALGITWTKYFIILGKNVDFLRVHRLQVLFHFEVVDIEPGEKG